jgi:hypothetical protein
LSRTLIKIFFKISLDIYAILWEKERIMTTYTFKTDTGLYDVNAYYLKEYSGSIDEPPEPEELEIVDVTKIEGEPLDIDDFYDNEDLYNSLLEQVKEEELSEYIDYQYEKYDGRLDLY